MESFSPAGKWREQLALMKQPLTKREIEIMKLMAVGHTWQEIAYRLRVNADTVEMYNKNIVRKLKVESASQAVASAIKMGLI